MEVARPLCAYTSELCDLKVPYLSMLHHLSFAILGNLADLSVVPLVICIILASCLASVASSSEQFDLRVVV